MLIGLIILFAIFMTSFFLEIASEGATLEHGNS